MFIDGKRVPAGSTIDVDLCIVGGGPAGISLAMQYVTNSNIKVALLESGGLEFDEETQKLAYTEAEGQAYFPVHETRLRVFGGSTISWGGIGAALSPLDFEKRPWIPHSGWPFSKTELDPYYADALPLAQMDPDTRETNEDESGPPAEGTKWSNVMFSAPTRFGQVYREDIERSSSVVAYLNTTALKLELHPDGRHIEGLQVGCLGGNRYRVAAGTYVLAGGGMENPRLLLTSNDVATAGIGNDRDLVGRYFQEHPRMHDRYRLTSGSAALAKRIVGAAGTLRFSRITVTAETQRKEGLLNYFANLAFGYVAQDSPQFDALRRLVNASRSPWKDSPYMQDIDGGPNRRRWEDVKKILKRPDRAFVCAVGAQFLPAALRRWVLVQSSVEQVPQRENRVVLTGDRDAFGIPRLKLIWRLHDDEERTYRRGLSIILRELDRLEPGLSENRIDDPDPWPGEVLGTWHHIGTTRMHDDPAHGVVDADCRVHGVDNLYVAGSSVFPIGGVTAPTLTIVALSLRLADHLKARLPNRATIGSSGMGYV
jgi:choline dehydrogenase-like flavoprotein